MTTQEQTQTTSMKSETQLHMGRVKWFNGKKGFGFISVLDGEHKGKEVFVYHEHIKVDKEQYRYLVNGDYVSFALKKETGDKYEFSAGDVTGICEGPLMCETRLQSREERPHTQDASEWTATKARGVKTTTRGRGGGRGRVRGQTRHQHKSHPTTKIET